MDGHQGHGILAGRAGGVELVGGVLLHHFQVGEEGGQGGASLQRAPFVGQVQEPVQVEAGAEPARRAHRLHVLPRPGDVEDGAAQLGEGRAVGGLQEAAVLGAEANQGGASASGEIIDRLQLVDPLQHRVCHHPVVIEVDLVAVAGAAPPPPCPAGEVSQIAQTQPVAGPEQDPQQGGTVVGGVEDPHPGP